MKLIIIVSVGVCALFVLTLALFVRRDRKRLQIHKSQVLEKLTAYSSAVGYSSFIETLSNLNRQDFDVSTTEFMAKHDLLRDLEEYSEKQGYTELLNSVNTKGLEHFRKDVIEFKTKYDLISSLFMYKERIKNFDEVVKQLSELTYSDVKNNVDRFKKQLSLSEKYSDEIVSKIMDKEYFLGMLEEHLIAMRGEPTKVEREVLKTKTKDIYIYGNKSSGDIFVFVDGKLESFKDR